MTKRGAHVLVTLMLLGRDAMTEATQEKEFFTVPEGESLIVMAGSMATDRQAWCCGRA